MGAKSSESLERHGVHLSDHELLQVVRQELERVLGGVQGGDRPGLPAHEQRRLKEGGFVLEPGEWGPDHPVVRGAAEFAALLGTALTVAEAARLLGVNQTRVRQRLTGPKRTLYGVKRDREWWLPRFQFTERGTVPGIGDVFAALDPELHPVSVWRWFTTPDPDLEGEDEHPLSPLDWLRAGYAPEAVVALAEHL